ncbi:MAG: YidB family protein [Thermodesulfovibrionales bacterium]
MGLFDEVAGGLARQFFGGDQNRLLESVTGLINNPQTGGLSGLVQMFKSKGLGDVIGSWVSTGNNLPVTADQLKQALGSDQIQEIATNAGVSQEEASNGLAVLLPEIIDKLTPDGKVPESDMLAQGLNMLKSKLFSG